VNDLRFQRGISWQDRPSEPLAEDGIGNSLRTSAGFAIVQQDAISFIAVAALLPYQGVGPTPQLGCHEW